MVDNNIFKQATHAELCDQALEHYESLAKECCHWNSIVPKAIAFYKEYFKEQGDNMDITIDAGLPTEFDIHYVRSVSNSNGWDHDEYAVGGQGEDMLRGLPELVKAVRAVVADASDENLAMLNKHIEQCCGDRWLRNN